MIIVGVIFAISIICAIYIQAADSKVNPVTWTDEQQGQPRRAMSALPAGGSHPTRATSKPSETLTWGVYRVQMVL